jgi:orotate phosphoribosyltransferase
MIDDVIARLPARQGHFALESGYHTDLWLSLDMMFVSPRRVAPLVTELASRLRPYRAEAICGPLLGGAFLALAVATTLDVDFYFAEQTVVGDSPMLFNAQYRLSTEAHRTLAGRRVIVVDDAISAGSSVRATAAALSASGATIVAVGSILLLGSVGRDHFASIGVPLESLTERELSLWLPAACPLCQAGATLENTIR